MGEGEEERSLKVRKYLLTKINEAGSCVVELEVKSSLLLCICVSLSNKREGGRRGEDDLLSCRGEEIEVLMDVGVGEEGEGALRRAEVGV